MNFLIKALSGMSGEPSTMRLCTIIIVSLVVGAWFIVSIQKRELQSLSYEQVALVLGALGVKAWQRGKETPPNEPANS